MKRSVDEVYIKFEKLDDILQDVQLFFCLSQVTQGFWQASHTNRLLS